MWERRRLLTFLKTLKLGRCLLEDLLGGEQSSSSAQIHKQQKQCSNPGRHAPPALLLVALQTFIIRFGPLRFADCLRIQQSASQGLWVQ